MLFIHSLSTNVVQHLVYVYWPLELPPQELLIHIQGSFCIGGLLSCYGLNAVPQIR